MSDDGSAVPPNSDELAAAIDLTAFVADVAAFDVNETARRHAVRTGHTITQAGGDPGWRCANCPVRSPAWDFQATAVLPWTMRGEPS